MSLGAIRLVSRWCLGDVSVVGVGATFFDGISVLFRWCLGDPSVVLWFVFCHVSVLIGCRINNVSAMGR